MGSQHPQQQSSFFRVPREIRDYIYKYYLYEEHGYIYDFECDKLRNRTAPTSTTCTSPDVTRLDLMYSCKRAAEEMRGVSFRHNTLHFTTGYSDRNQGEYQGLRSRAGRFHCLLLYVQLAKMEMIRHAAQCITPQIQAQIAQRYPAVSDWFGQPLQRARPTRGPQDWFPVPGIARDTDIYRHNLGLSESFDDALQFALQLVCVQHGTKFNDLASKALCPIHPHDKSRRSCYIGGDHRHYFIEGSFTKILSWRPPTWSIPSENDLSAMEACLTEHRQDLNVKDLPDPIIGFRPVRQIALATRSTDTKWRFSATAVAIKFLESLSVEQRSQMRYIVITEDHKAVGGPECHAKGLIPFCIENTLLQVDIHIGLWTNMLPGHWFRIMDNRFSHEKTRTGSECLGVFFKWADEADQLLALGMPPRSLTIVFEGHSDETLQAWNILKRAACMQEAITTWSSRKDLHLRPLWQDTGMDHLDRFPLPCDLPPVFAKTIRNMVQKTSIIRFDGDPGELWDAEALVVEAHDWTLDDWQQAWRNRVLWSEVPAEDWSANLRQRYNMASNVS